MTSKTAEPTFQGTESATEKIPKNESAEKRVGDLNSGMELLEPDFLLSIVEDTEGDGKNDVTMRKLTFNELLRRENQKQIDSHALAVYAVNKDDLYGKDIQCEAMKELTKRTIPHNKHNR